MKIKNIEKIFLIISFLFGLIFICINPPFQSPDEPEHLYKMYGYTKGVLRYQVLNGRAGLILPESFLKIKNMYANLPFNYYSATSFEVLKSASKLELEPEKTVFLSHTPTSYLPVSYFPVAIVLQCLLLLKIKPLIIIYILRLTELFLYTGLMWGAIRLTPVKKHIFAIIGLLPMALYMGCSINTDALVIGLSALFIAFFFKLAYDDQIKTISFKHILIASFVIFTIVLCKLPYISLIFLFLIIPTKKFKGFVPRFLYFSFLSAAAFGAFYLFVYYGKNILNATLNTSSFSQASSATGNILEHIVLHPIYYIKAINTSFLVLYKDQISAFIGRFGWLDTFLPGYVINFCLIVLLIISALKDKTENNSHFSLFDKFIFFIVIYFAYILISLSGFLTFRQLTPYILGIQGRYLIPIAPCILSIFSLTKFKFDTIVLDKLVLYFSITGLSISAYFIFLRFYMTSYVQLWD